MRAFGTRAAQLEFIYTKKLLDRYVTPPLSIIEVGCGTGYYGLYLSDKCKLYHGVDLTPRNIERFQLKIHEFGLTNMRASVGDATNLSEIEEATYDVVLNFGPLYHLPLEERKKAILESIRICKAGGIVMFAYINKIGAYLGACFDEKWKQVYPNEKVNKSVLTDGMDDMFPDIFFYTMPEEIEGQVAECGLTILQNAGVDFSFCAGKVNSMSDEQFAAWIEVLDFMLDSDSCTGTSSHAVLVCRKD